MHESLKLTLHDYRPTLLRDWEKRLRAAPASSPLGQPGALVHLMSWTLDRLVEDLRRPGRTHRRPPAPCDCGHNPLIAYFVTGKAALNAVLALVALEHPELDPLDISAATEAADRAWQHLAKRELETFCTVCQYRIRAEGLASCAPDHPKCAQAAATGPCKRSR